MTGRLANKVITFDITFRDISSLVLSTAQYFARNRDTAVLAEGNDNLRPVYSDATQLHSTSSCVAIDILTDATQLSPAIGNATDPVEQRTANQRGAGQSSQVVSL